MIRFTPIYQSRLWGGRRLADTFGRNLPQGMDDCGESWEISDRPEAMSLVCGGAWHGLSLHELWKNHRNEIFGNGYDFADRFPILAKILTPEQMLSVQIHPDAATATALGGEEKNECWYFADSCGTVDLFAGLAEGTAPDDALRALQSGNITRHLQRFSAHTGESIFIPASTIHALGAPCIVFEIQQNADTTYRLDDWGRRDAHGNPRPLHISEATACLRRLAPSPHLRQAGEGIIADTPWFKIEEVHLAEGDAIPIANASHFALVAVVSGEVAAARQRASAGDFFLIPVGEDTPRAVSPHARVLVTIVPPQSLRA